MADQLPPDLHNGTALKLILGPIFAALVGTIMRLANGLASGTPPSLWRAIADLLSAVGIGIMAAGAATAWGAPEIVAWALAAAAGYLGPNVLIEMLVERWNGRRP